jgi:hypothetical protein
VTFNNFNSLFGTALRDASLSHDAKLKSVREELRDMIDEKMKCLETVPDSKFFVRRDEFRVFNQRFDAT